ncbi:MAG: IclR family transcriptional regulator [Pseudomonadota bacterium]
MTESTTRRPRGRPKSAGADEAGGTVQALDRGLTLLNALARDGRATLTELSLGVGMPAATAHRLLATLARRGYAAFDEASQTWSIGLQAFRVGAAFARETSLIDAARPVMRALMEETGETANLGLPDGDEIVFVAQIETANPIRALFHIGARGPMHATGIGKALLAAEERRAVETRLRRTGLAAFTPRTRAAPAALFEDLDHARAAGWALDDEERHVGMRCVAAAIRNERGEAVAGVSVSGPSARFPDARVAEIGAAVRRAAQAITEAIGGETAGALGIEARPK